MLETGNDVARSINQISYEFNLPKERVKDYGIARLLTPNVVHVCKKEEKDKKILFLDDNKKLMDYKFNKMEELYFTDKLRPIKFQFLDGVTMEIYVDFTLIIYDLLDEIRTCIKQFPEDVTLYWQMKGGGGISGVMNFS